jgi:hypothetical protein
MRLLLCLVVLLSCIALYVEAASINQDGEAGLLSTRSSKAKKVGSSCKTSTSCQSSYCNQGKCANKQALGKSCSKSQGCTSGSCVNKKCVPQSGQGKLKGYCNSSSQCQSGYCGYGNCVSKAAVGGSCYKDVSKYRTKRNEYLADSVEQSRAA